MGGYINLTGQTFGRLKVLRDVGRSWGNALWRCSCDCGREITVSSGNLRSGKTDNCGKHRAGIPQYQNRKHGMDGTPEYNAWRSMKKRCNLPSDVRYKYYGARGITVCQEWMDSFQKFYDDMGPRPDGHSLDRIDNNGNYEPSNCRWATIEQQNLNRRSKVLQK